MRITGIRRGYLFSMTKEREDRSEGDAGSVRRYYLAGPGPIALALLLHLSLRRRVL